MPQDSLPVPESSRPQPPADLQSSPLALARYCAQLLDSKKMDDVVIFDVRDSLQIADYFVIASGMNARHLKGACDLVDRRLGDAGVQRLSLEGYREGVWVLLDFDYVIVHLFLEGQRRMYDLELLWGDSPQVEWTPLTPAG